MESQTVAKPMEETPQAKRIMVDNSGKYRWIYDLPMLNVDGRIP